MGSGDTKAVSFPLPFVPTSGCSLEPVVCSCGRLCLFVSESVPDSIAGLLASSLSELDGSPLGSLTVEVIVLFTMVGTPGLSFLGTTFTGGFLKGPGPSFFPPGTLVALKRKGPETFGFLGSAGLLMSFPSDDTFLLTTGLVFAITVAEETLFDPSISPAFTASLPSPLRPGWSLTLTLDDRSTS